MPRINPRSLIKCLDCLLNEHGGIRGTPEVARVIGLMGKFSNTLVSKVCYTLILSKTEGSLLTEFLAAGGWKLVFQWLGDAIVNGNNPFIKEILQLLIICPVRIDFLRESNAPRIVKGLSKDSEDPVVRDLAKRVVEMWLDYIKTNQAELCHVSEPAQAPESPPEPVPVQESTAEKVAPFKLILRGGKRYLVPIVPENVCHKLKRTKTENDGDSLTLKVDQPVKNKFMRMNTEDDSDDSMSKLEQQVTNKVRRIKTEYDSDDYMAKVEQHVTSKIKRIKTEDHSDSYMPKVEQSIKVVRNDKKSDIIRFKPKTSIKSESEVKNRDVDKIRSDKKDYQRSSSQKSSKPSHSKLKEGESRNVRDHNKIKSKPAKLEARSKSKENLKKSEGNEDGLIRPTPAISSLGKIPKKTAPTATMSAAEVTATGGVLGGGAAKEPNPLPVVKKGTFSDERKRTAEIKPSDRPKTVKTLPTKFRSTGLEEEVKPPIRKKEPVKDIVKRPVPSSPKEVSVPPEKKPKLLENKEKVEKPGIKLIPAKPKLVLVESDMFSDALTASSSKEPRKKKSRRSSSSSTKDDGKKEGNESSSKHRKSRSPPKAASPADVKPPKFYRDTLEEPENQPKKTESEEEEDEDSSGSPKSKLYPDGILVVSRSRRAPKKSIRWRGETDLVSIKFFDLDENERVNVTRCNFMDLKTMERSREREYILLHKQGTESEKGEKPWGPLYRIDIPADKRAPERGLKSLEKEIQLARQRTVLEAIFFHKSNLPDSPAEPDPENHPMTDPKPMPLEDGSGKEFDHSNTPWPDGKTDKPDGLPAVIPAAIPTFPATAYSYPGFPGVPGPESWLPGESGKEGPTAVAAVAAAFPQNGLSIPPPFAAIRAPFGPPPNGMMGPDGYMYPPSGFPMPFGPVPPMGMMPGWGRGGGGWSGPRPPLPLEAHNICKSWSRSGKCYRGVLCRFLHPGSNCPPLS